MNPRIKLFIVLLGIVGLVASLTLPGKVFELGTKIYSGTASPYSLDWMGTSTLYNYLVKRGYKVFIAESWSQLINMTRDNTIIFIIAPQKPINTLDAMRLYEKASLHTNVTLIIADENITSNNLLRFLGLEIDGRMIFQYEIYNPTLYGIRVGDGYMTPYPVAVYIIKGEPICLAMAKNRSLCIYTSKTALEKILLRLNYASYIEIKPYPGLWNVEYHIISYITNGMIDVNDNGFPDEYPHEYRSGRLCVALLVVFKGRLRAFVFSDSFIFTNQALASPANKTYLKIVDHILSFHNPNKTLVIIDNSHYIPRIIYKRIPYHPAMIIYLVAKWLQGIDRFITEQVMWNRLFAFGMALAVSMSVALAARKIMGIREGEFMETDLVDEVSVLLETPLRKSIVSGGAGEGAVRSAIVMLWRILNRVTKRYAGISLEEALTNNELFMKLSTILNIKPERFRKIIKWMARLYISASSGRRLRPLFLWRRRLSKFIEYSEEILEIMGYTIVRRAGYRGVEEALS